MFMTTMPFSSRPGSIRSPVTMILLKKSSILLSGRASIALFSVSFMVSADWM